MSTNISMGTVEKYLEVFVLLDGKYCECNGDLLRLPLFKIMLFECCQNPEIEFDEEAIKKAIRGAEYVYGKPDQIEALVRKRAREIRESESAGVTAFELFKTRMELRLVKKQFDELEKKLSRIEKRLKQGKS